MYGVLERKIGGVIVMDMDLWEKCVDFHGHECPGLAIGYRAAVEAVERLGINKSDDEQLVCVTENDACGVDAVQRILSCTIGKGNLIYRGTGKMAFSFFERKSGKKVRFCLKSFKGDMSREERMKYILTAPFDELYTVTEPSFELPESARIFNSIKCEICGESAPEHRIRLMDGKKVCLDCFKDYNREW